MHISHVDMKCLHYIVLRKMSWALYIKIGHSVQPALFHPDKMTECLGWGFLGTE